MLIEQYYNDQDGKISFTRQQANDFAKQVADDFNPLHDADSKRFCVPGDLLFAVVLARYGVNQQMRFSFTGMVSEETKLTFPDAGEQLSITGNNQKEYLNVSLSGDNSRNTQLIDSLTQSYVTFSGRTFPHILIPLMESQNVMINPDRPMVMYQSMVIELERLDVSNIELELDQAQTQIKMDGKRGNVCLAFKLKANGEVIGRGEKHMLLSGLRPFEREVIDSVAENYARRKAEFRS